MKLSLRSGETIDLITQTLACLSQVKTNIPQLPRSRFFVFLMLTYTPILTSMNKENGGAYGDGGDRAQAGLGMRGCICVARIAPGDSRHHEHCATDFYADGGVWIPELA
jgi:hypothetical protein